MTDDVVSLHTLIHKAAAVAGSISPEMVVAHDALIPSLPIHSTPLEPRMTGLYLPALHAQLIAGGKKTAIVQKAAADLAGPRVLVGSDKKAYGVVWLAAPEPLDASDFDAHFQEHRITAKERARWWPDYAQGYLYRIESFNPFPNPIPVDVPPGTRIHMPEINFDQVLVKDFVWLVGSAADGRQDFNDVDILVRAGYDEDARGFVIDGEGLQLLLRKALDPDKSQNLHFLAQPQGPHQGTALAMADLVLRFHAPETIVIRQAAEQSAAGFIKPVFPKPRMRFYTEAFSPDELWDQWGAEHAPFFAEAKYNGFRACLQKRGDAVSLLYEGQDEEQIEKFPDLLEQVRALSHDFTFDADMGISQDGRPWSRVELAVLNSDAPELPPGAEVVVTVFDVLWWGEDVRGLPFEQRRALLESIFPLPPLRLSQGMPVETPDDLRKAFDTLSAVPTSEGLVTKDLRAPYPDSKATDAWAKIKKVVEIKVIVLEKKATEDGQFNYRCGLLVGDGTFTNLYTDDPGYLDLGYTYNTTIEANPGDILTVHAEEIIVNAELDWQDPHVIDIDCDRTDPYYALQVVDLARRGGILQERRDEGQEEETQEEQPEQDAPRPTQEPQVKADSDEIPREELADEWWSEHWPEMLPRSGRGKFVYQHHYPALTEEQLAMDEQELWDEQPNVSAHGDLRFTSQRGDLWGFSVFEHVQDFREYGGTKLAEVDVDIRGAFKPAEPIEWLTLAHDEPYILAGERGDVGVTGKEGTKIFEVDTGDYELGTCKEHFFELFLHGDKLSGRYIIQSMPVEGGERVWIISRRGDQTPFSESHDLEEELAHQREEGRKLLVWGVPGEVVFYDVKTGKAMKQRRRIGERVTDLVERVKSLLAPTPDLSRTRIHIFKQAGSWWLMTWSANAFKDADGQIISTRALEDCVRRKQDGATYGVYRFWHIPGTDFATKRWQGVVGRFLVELGTFNDDWRGRLFQAFFSEFPEGHPDIAPEGWGASIGFYAHDGDEVDGVFEYIEDFETSVLPLSAAANPYTKMEVLKMLTDKQREALKSIGGERLLRFVEHTGQRATRDLEERGVEYRSRRVPVRKALSDYAAEVKEIAELVEDATLKEALLALADELAGKKPEEEKMQAIRRMTLKMRLAARRGAVSPQAAIRMYLLARRMGAVKTPSSERRQVSRERQEQIRGRIREWARSVPSRARPRVRARPAPRRLEARPSQRPMRRASVPYRRPVRRQDYPTPEPTITPEEAIATLEGLLQQAGPEIAGRIQELIDRIRNEFGIPEEGVRSASYGVPVGYQYPQPETPTTEMRRLLREVAALRREMRQAAQPKREPRFNWYRASQQNDDTGKGPTVVAAIADRLKNL